MKKDIFYVTVAAMLFTFATAVHAKTDLSISETDVTFSKEDILSGETVTVYARIFNIGDTNVFGNVVFLNNGKEISDPQPVSVRPNTYDDVFITWKPDSGNYSITAKIIGLNPPDDNVNNNLTVKKEVFVDNDTDHDGIGDKKDTDPDSDTLTISQEKAKHTDPLKADTDGDAVNDNIDAFPLDKSKWGDANTATVPTGSDSGQVASVPVETSESPKSKYQAVYDQIQKGIESITQSAPVQTVAQYIDKATGGKIPEAYKAVTSKLNLAAVANNTIDYKKPAGGIFELVKTYWPWGAAILGVLFLLFLYKSWRGRE